MESNLKWKSADFEKYNLELPNDRLGFIQKVLLILLTQLSLTSVLIYFSMSWKSFRSSTHDHSWVALLSLFLSVIILLGLYLFKPLSRTFPLNYLLLLLFTLLKSFFISCITSSYDPTTVLLSCLLTFLLTLSLTSYAFFTKSDFTLYNGVLLSASFGILVFGLILFISGSHNIYRLVFCPIAVTLYGIYLVYDIQLIVGDRRHKLGYDEYILGAVSLYIDIIGIFLHILTVFGKKQ